MSAAIDTTSSALGSAGGLAPRTEKTLHRLFITLFLRGRTSRGLNRKGAPKSVGNKLALTLLFYGCFGLFALVFIRQPVFGLSVYLHAMTFVFVGMFVAASSGEILFNKEEGEILLHRPITPRALLWAKVRVLMEVSLWLAGAFNLSGFFVGLAASDGSWLFPVAHALSTVLEAFLCTGMVVLVYQLCLRWFGRERLEGLMTTAQVVVSVVAVLSGQLLPRIVFQFNKVATFGRETWWMALAPPAWFAGFDDAIAGSRAPGSWLLAVIGLIATVAVVFLALGKLARDYQTGLLALSETAPRRISKSVGRRWIDRLAGSPPMRWVLRDPVTRASFLLTAAYLMRDRDVKLRLYPGIAPMLVMPVIFLFPMARGRGVGQADFGIAFVGCYAAMVPLLAISILQYSQQWQASDIFRVAPIVGPAPICRGARIAIFLLLAVPLLAAFAAIIWVMKADHLRLLLLLPGLIALPVYSLLPHTRGRAVPLSLPTEEAKATGRGMAMMGIMLLSFIIAGLSLWSWNEHWFRWFLAAETAVMGSAYLVLRRQAANVRWQSIE